MNGLDKHRERIKLGLLSDEERFELERVLDAVLASEGRNEHEATDGRSVGRVKTSIYDHLFRR